MKDMKDIIDIKDIKGIKDIIMHVTFREANIKEWS